MGVVTCNLSPPRADVTEHSSGPNTTHEAPVHGFHGCKSACPVDMPFEAKMKCVVFYAAMVHDLLHAGKGDVTEEDAEVAKVVLNVTKAIASANSTRLL